MFIKQGYAFTLCRSDNKLRERAQMKTKFCVKKKTLLLIAGICMSCQY